MYPKSSVNQDNLPVRHVISLAIIDVEELYRHENAQFNLVIIRDIRPNCPQINSNPVIYQNVMFPIARQCSFWLLSMSCQYIREVDLEAT